MPTNQSHNLSGLSARGAHCSAVAAIVLAAHAFSCGAALAAPGEPSREPLLQIPTVLVQSQVSEPPATQTPAAETPATLETQTPTYDPAASSTDTLQASFTPYIWLTSFNGTTGAKGIEVDVDQSFGDIFSASDSVFGLMGTLDLSYNRFIFQFNGAYSAAEFSGTRATSGIGPNGAQVELDASLDLELTTAWVEALAGYRFYESKFGENQQNSMAIDAFGGLRYTYIGMDQTLTTQGAITLPNGNVLAGGQSHNLDDSEDWVEPFVGLRTGLKIGKNWELFLRGDVGGFGVSDSEFSWNIVAGGGYRWYYETWSFGLVGGYRALGQDYSNEEFKWDVVTHGLFTGFSFNWDF